MEGCEGFLSDAYASTSKALTKRREKEAPSSLAEAAACVEATRSIEILIPSRISPVRVAGVAYIIRAVTYPVAGEVPISIWINVYFAFVATALPAYKKRGNRAAEEDRVTPSIFATVIFCLNTPSRCCTFCSSPIGSCWPHRWLVNWHDAPFFCRGTMVL